MDNSRKEEKGRVEVGGMWKEYTIEAAGSREDVGR